MSAMLESAKPHIGASPFRFTRAQYYQLNELGDFRARRVELICGQIRTMSPIHYPHTAGLELVARALFAVFGDEYWLRSQSPFTMPDDTEPEPDLAVVLGSPRTMRDHPTTAELIVEIAASSLDYDTGEKANLYAGAGIRDYWVLDLDNRRLWVFRDPQPDATAPHGHRYASLQTLGPTDTIAALAAPVPLRVEDLLP